MTSFGGSLPGDSAPVRADDPSKNDGAIHSMNQATRGARESGTGGHPNDGGGKGGPADKAPPQKPADSKADDSSGSRTRNDSKPTTKTDDASSGQSSDKPVLPADGSVTSTGDQWKIAPPVSQSELDFLTKGINKDRPEKPEAKDDAAARRHRAGRDFNKSATDRDKKTTDDTSAPKKSPGDAHRAVGDVTAKDRQLVDAARKRLDNAFAPEDPSKHKQNIRRPRLADPSDLRIGKDAIDGGFDRNKAAFGNFTKHTADNVGNMFNISVNDFVKSLDALAKGSDAAAKRWLSDLPQHTGLSDKTLDAMVKWINTQADRDLTKPNVNRLTPVQDSGIGGAHRSSMDTIKAELRTSRHLTDFEKHWENLSGKDVTVTVAVKDTPWVMVVDKTGHPLGFFYGDGVGSNLPVGVHGMDGKRGGYVSLTDGKFRPAGQFMERIVDEAHKGKFGVALKDRFQTAQYADLKSKAKVNLITVLRPDANATASPIGKVCDAVRMAIDHLGDATRKALGQLATPDGIAVLSAAMLSKTVMKALGVTFAVDLVQAAGIAGYAKTQFEKEFASRLIAKHLGMIVAGGGLILGAKVAAGRIRAAIASRIEGSAGKGVTAPPGPEAPRTPAAQPPRGRDVIGDRSVSGTAKTEPRVVVGDPSVSPAAKTQRRIAEPEPSHRVSDRAPSQPRRSEPRPSDRAPAPEPGAAASFDHVRSEFHKLFGGDSQVGDVWQTLRPHLGRNAAEIAANEAIFKELAAAHPNSVDGVQNIMAWAIDAAKVAKNKGQGIQAAATHLQAEGYLLRHMKASSSKQQWEATKSWHVAEPHEHPAQIFLEDNMNMYFEARWDRVPQNQKLGDSRLMARTYRQAGADAAEAMKQVMDPMTRAGVDFLWK